MRTAGLLIFLAITSPALTAAAQGAEATVYFVAPDAAAARKANLLPYEATLRTAAVVLASRGAAVRYVPREQLGSLGPEDYPRIEFDFSAEEWPVVKRERVDRSKVLTVARFKTGSWAELLTSVADEAADILEGLFEEGRIKAVALKPGDAEKLDEALALVCERGPDGARAAAAKIEEVLANGPSAAALRAACLPGACLAGIDLYGHFQYRNRVLALPVSFAAAARLVVGADEAEGRPSPEKLAEAWVALLCGFPAESLEMVKAAGELEGAAASLARALEVGRFATGGATNTLPLRSLQKRKPPATRPPARPHGFRSTMRAPSSRWPGCGLWRTRSSLRYTLTRQGGFCAPEPAPLSRPCRRSTAWAPAADSLR